jgi:hypothetical protein
MLKIYIHNQTQTLYHLSKKYHPVGTILKIPDSNKTLISCVLLLLLLLLYCGFYLLLLLQAETRIVYDSMLVSGSGQNEQSL